ncbi:PREDICTED: putative F-box protein At1g53550 isoform X2 [Tarenaya hassleriana]|uniref:putative F-box protein At1g53550 isoform X2 n=1 Tax=Tarenaya hassleriana TaxID=28532 RepID=UPI00053C8BE9|nr:PREDICTED: putative F-box protein At1g53550 isoform X2 [Tarenaya hassleriana]
MSKETATGHSGQPPWQKPLPHTTDMPTESPPGNSPFGLFSISLSKILTKLVAIFRIMSILLGKKKMTEICRTKLNQNSQTCSVRNRGESEDVSNPIITPDLTFEILSRLPAKTLVRSQCVSKDWSSIIHSPHFANSFLARSSTRPRLLVAFPDTKRRHSVLYSSPHPENHGHDSILVASHEMTIPLCLRFTQSIHGLFCSQNAHELSICNPATKKFVTLPEIGSKKTLMYSFFGYDHVSHQYKVLSITHNPNYDQVVREESDTEHWVFTLSSSQKEWRKIKGIRSEYPSCGLCINGVLYYGASRFTRNPPIIMMGSWLSYLIIHLGLLSGSSFMFLRMSGKKKNGRRRRTSRRVTEIYNGRQLYVFLGHRSIQRRLFWFGDTMRKLNLNRYIFSIMIGREITLGEWKSKGTKNLGVLVGKLVLFVMQSCCSQICLKVSCFFKVIFVFSNS